MTVPERFGLVAGLLLGALGGLVFHWLALPLPWMLGALFLTMAASLAGIPVRGPNRARPAVVAVIGVLLGSRFTPEVLAEAQDTAVTLLVLLVYLLAVAAVVVPYYRFIGRQDWITAYVAGMPGGLAEMVELAEAKGAHVPSVVLAHSLRIVLTIGLMVFLFRVILDHDLGARTAGRGGGELSPLDAALLALCAVFGAIAATRLRLPAAAFLGPLVLSAALHLAGLTQSVPPPLLVIAAQVVLGTILGCRFRGIPSRTLVSAGLLSLGATVLTLCLAAGAGLLMQAAVGITLDQALLALAPGGLTEMGLMALAIHADVAFVALHHVTRILIVIIVAPMLVRHIHRRH